MYESVQTDPISYFRRLKSLGFVLGINELETTVWVFWPARNFA